MAETAALTRRASLLTDHGLRLALGTLIGYQDKTVRTAVLAALGGAEAGQGLTEEPRPAHRVPPVLAPPPGATHAVWHEAAGLNERDGDGTLAECLWFAARQGGEGAGYRVLPLGEHPDGTEPPADPGTGGICNSLGGAS